jgi:hypothetical protein
VPQDPAELEAQIEATRQELASTIDAIAVRVNPRNVAARGQEQLKARFEQARNDPAALPWPKIAAVAAVLVLLVAIRSRRSRGHK